MSVINSYEIVMVFSVKQGDEATAALVSKFTDMINENGSEVAVDEWGKRKLAYAIEDETEGYYTLVSFKSEPEFHRRRSSFDDN